jgi:hypothetical protein
MVSIEGSGRHFLAEFSEEPLLPGIGAVMGR